MAKKDICIWGFGFIVALLAVMIVKVEFLQFMPKSTAKIYVRHDGYMKFEEISLKIYLAKAFALIAQGNGDLQFAHELNVEVDLLLEAVMKYDATSIAKISLQSMSLLLEQAQQYRHYDIAARIVTLDARIRFLMRQDDFDFYVEEGMSKSLHCLSVLLSGNIPLVGKVKTYPKSAMMMKQKRYVDNDLHHFCILSDNLLRTSVAVNSTISNYKISSDLIVFHIIITEINLSQMKLWFNTKNFGGATFDIQKFKPNYDVKELKGTVHAPSRPAYQKQLKMVILNLPQIYLKLHKVVYLSDDVVVLEDLSPLFSIDMKGKVNGAVEYCDNRTCSWEFGLNIFDLIEWRKRNVTDITFNGLVMPLDPMWHMLMTNNDIDQQFKDRRAAVLHFNRDSQDAKLVDLGMKKFKSVRNKYLNYSDSWLVKCHVRGY